MTWTNEQRQELSRKVAEKFSLNLFLPHGFIAGADVGGWLHDDWHTIMELCVKHGVYGQQLPDKLCAIANTKPIKRMNEVAYYADHNGDPSLAERIARMMALMEVEL